MPETLFGRLNEDGTVTGGIKIPGFVLILSDPSQGTSTVIQGRNAFPIEDQPTIVQANTVHLVWDLMIGLGTLLFLLSVWYGLSWLFRRDIPKSRWFLRVAASAGDLFIIAMEAGWVVTEVGRHRWIVFGHMKVEDAASHEHGSVGDVRRDRAALHRGPRDDGGRVATDEPAVPRGLRARRARGERDPYGPCDESSLGSTSDPDKAVTP